MIKTTRPPPLRCSFLFRDSFINFDAWKIVGHREEMKKIARKTRQRGKDNRITRMIEKAWRGKGKKRKHICADALLITSAISLQGNSSGALWLLRWMEIVVWNLDYNDAFEVEVTCHFLNFLKRANGIIRIIVKSMNRSIPYSSTKLSHNNTQLNLIFVKGCIAQRQ